MKSVSKRTGLSPHVIRVWERRYGAVKPTRTSTNRRVYNEEDVTRLELLQRATEAGHSISQACKLTNAQLKGLLRESLAAASVTPSRAHLIQHQWGNAITQRALEAVRALDIKSLESALKDSVMELGTQGLLTQVAAPLAQKVGELWQRGVLGASHEHFLSAALRTFLGRHAQQYSVPPNAPVIVVTTPTGQLHELGAVIVSASAANLGWRVVYLGTSLPATEIAGIAKQQNARVVALSIIYPQDDPALPAELHQLRDYLPGEIEIIVGGRGAPAYAPTLVEIGARVATRLEDLFPALDTVRGSGPKR